MMNTKKINVTFVIKKFPSLVRFRKQVLIFHKNSEIIKTADDKSNHLANRIKMKDITEH